MRGPEDSRYKVGALLHRDDFDGTAAEWADRWTVEREGDAGVVEAGAGLLTVDVPRGCTVWFRPELVGPVLIEYDATAVARGGPNDRVSDLNCFWMAREPALAGAPEARRGGAFAEYDTLCAYYVGLGGNSNTTTRFRRYIGKAGDRPLLPEHDLRSAEFLLRPNARQHIRLVACGSLVQFWRDGRRLFELEDGAPYTRGWFALRTVTSHLRIERFRVYRLVPTGLPDAAAPFA
jgi:hypothetical protein